MSRRSRAAASGAASGPASGPAQPTVTVCRGCCCGRSAKVPRLDHAAQLAELRAGVAGHAKLRVVDCLDACERANVIVVQPAAAARREGARPVWFGQVNDPDAAADLNAWIAAGGPGAAELPDILDLYRFQPSRRVREELED